MAQVTRRGFLAKASVGVAALGAAAAMPGITAAEVDAAPEFRLSEHELAGPIVVHVRDLKTGEVALMVGTREIIYRDPAFVARLRKAAR